VNIAIKMPIKFKEKEQDVQLGVGVCVYIVLLEFVVRYHLLLMIVMICKLFVAIVRKLEK
jgi:hypothetical protein